MCHIYVIVQFNIAWLYGTLDGWVHWDDMAGWVSSSANAWVAQYTYEGILKMIL